MKYLNDLELSDIDLDEHECDKNMGVTDKYFRDMTKEYVPMTKFVDEYNKKRNIVIH